MEKPIFSTVQGFMEHRHQRQKIIKTFQKVREALILSRAEETMDLYTESPEIYLLALVEEIEELVEELQDNDSG